MVGDSHWVLGSLGYRASCDGAARVPSHSPLHSATAWGGFGFCQHHGWWSVKGPLRPERPWWRHPVVRVLCGDLGFPGGGSFLPQRSLHARRRQLRSEGRDSGLGVAWAPACRAPAWGHGPALGSAPLSARTGLRAASSGFLLLLLLSSFPHWRPLSPGFSTFNCLLTTRK